MGKYSKLVLTLLALCAVGCTAEKEPQSYAEAVANLSTDKNFKWEHSPGVLISVFKEYEQGKPYATTLYENFGADTVERIKYQLITENHGKFDTTLREIKPPKLLRPKDRHSVPRYIGEDTVAWESAHVGEVWVVKNK